MDADRQETTTLTAGPLEGAVMASRKGELDLFAFFLLLRLRLLRTILFAFGLAALTALYVMHLPPRFSATGSVLIPQQNTKATVSIQAISGLDLLGGGFDVYVDILKSRTVQDTLIARFHLMEHYHARNLPQAETALEGATTAAASKEGLIRVTVVDTDPQLTADLANAYFVELDKLNQKVSLTAAGQQRRYFESEMNKERDALAVAEAALEQNQERSGVLEPTAQAQASLGAAEGTRAQLRSLQVQLQALEQGATAQNPEVIRLKAQIAGLAGQLSTMEQGGGQSAGPGAARMPGQALAYARAAREVKFHEGMFAALQAQFEAARLEESRETSVIQVLDPAVKPLQKSWPPRTLYTLVGFFLGGIFGIVYTALEELYRVIARNPENRTRLAALARGRRAARAR